MFGTIVLAVDSSPQAERAGALAARLATATGDEVVVVHVLYLSDRPVLVAPWPSRAAGSMPARLDG